MRIHLIHGIHSNGVGNTGKLAPYFRDAGFDAFARRYGWAFASPAVLPGFVNWQNERRAKKLAAAIAAHNPLIKSAAQIQAAADAEALAEAKADNVVQYLRDHTPAEAAKYVQDNVTDLASAKAFLKKVAAILSVLSKESLR